MTRRWTSDQQRRLTVRAMEAANLEMLEVWIRYFEYTGTADELELDAHLAGVMLLSDEQADILAYAVNDLIDEIPQRPRAPFSFDTVTREAPGDCG